MHRGNIFQNIQKEELDALKEMTAAELHETLERNQLLMPGINSRICTKVSKKTAM